MGRGPHLLLLHGAGASTHSFQALMPPLATQFQMIAVDLPGQGFTRLGTKQRSGLEPMGEDLAALCAQEGWSPTAIIGHSAGAALALELARTLPSPPGQIIGINPALANYGGPSSRVFSALAKMLAANPFTAGVFSLTGGSMNAVRRMISGTGSTLDPDGLELYRRLVSSRKHVDGTLAMMSQWNLNGLRRALPDLDVQTLFITGAQDKAVQPETAKDAAKLMPQAQVISHNGYGHLIHEEAPDLVVTDILTFLERPTRTAQSVKT
jgi:magnesium chelatase accessory protein